MIIAVDFDGVLCENAFPDIGKPKYEVISLVRELIDEGHEVILWTTRVEKELEAAADWCDDRGLHFCNVNGPAPSNLKKFKGTYQTEPRKVFADVYIDDHNLEFMRAGMEGESNMVKHLRSLREVRVSER